MIAEPSAPKIRFSLISGMIVWKVFRSRADTIFEDQMIRILTSLGCTVRR